MGGARSACELRRAGLVSIEMTDDLLADEKGRRFIERMTVLGRPGLAGEFDGAVIYLAGDESSYVTGQTLAVDGGWTSI